MTSEQNLRNAIIKKNEAEITKFTEQYAEYKLDLFSLGEDTLAKFKDKAVKAVLKGYSKFDHKKKWNKAIPFITDIINHSISTSVWSINK